MGRRVDTVVHWVTEDSQAEYFKTAIYFHRCLGPLKARHPGCRLPKVAFQSVSGDMIALQSRLGINEELWPPRPPCAAQLSEDPLAQKVSVKLSGEDVSVNAL